MTLTWGARLLRQWMADSAQLPLRIRGPGTAAGYEAVVLVDDGGRGAATDTAPDERNTAFLRSWVVREARLKAEGRGIWSGPGTSSDGQRLTHRLFAPRPSYIAAVAAPDSDWRLYTCAIKPE